MFLNLTASCRSCSQTKTWAYCKKPDSEQHLSDVRTPKKQDLHQPLQQFLRNQLRDHLGRRVLPQSSQMRASTRWRVSSWRTILQSSWLRRLPRAQDFWASCNISYPSRNGSGFLGAIDSVWPNVMSFIPNELPRFRNWKVCLWAPFSWTRSRRLKSAMTTWA